MSYFIRKFCRLEVKNYRNSNIIEVPKEIIKEMFLISVLAVFLAGIFALLLANRYRRTHSKYLKKLPGKEPNVFFGNMLDFMGSTDKKL